MPSILYGVAGPGVVWSDGGMRIMLAPDSFKGSLTATEAVEAMAEGIGRVSATIQIDRCPLSDGGEGFIEAMHTAGGGDVHIATVENARGRSVDASWLILPDGTAVIEMAQAAGLAHLPPEQRLPLHTHTRGVGQLIGGALDAGCRTMIIGIGGSATNDAGLGMIQAMGAQLLDPSGDLVPLTPVDAAMGNIQRIDLSGFDPRVADCDITIACDVTNPLTGPNGASAVYGPQKGANPEQVASLDRAMQQLAGVIHETVGFDVSQRPGAGAAGGLGAALMAFCGGTPKPGITLLLDAVGFDERISRCDLCLTGEGRLDGQSLSGKAVMGIAHAAMKHNTPTVALVGSAAGDADQAIAQGLHAYQAIGQGLPTDVAMAKAGELLSQHTFDVVQRWMVEHETR